MDEFNILPKEEQVKIGDAVYTIRELSEVGSIENRRQMSRGVTMNEEGKPSGVPIDNIAENDSFLLSRCLFDDKGTPVSLDTIRGWPRRVVRALADKCEAINKVEKGEPKNSPSAGTDTSA